MPRQRHEAEFSEPMVEVFSALLVALGRHRWAEGARRDAHELAPRVGCRYVNRRGSVLRRGRVLECLRPVSLTCYETLFDPPCRVRLKLRWRLDQIAAGSRLRLELSYELNGAATLRGRHWSRQIDAHCGRMLGFVSRQLAAQAPEVTGQIHGSNSMVSTKTTMVSGMPSLK